MSRRPGRRLPRFHGRRAELLTCAAEVGAGASHWQEPEGEDQALLLPRRVCYRMARGPRMTSPDERVMSEQFDLVLKGGTVVTPWGTGVADVGIRVGRIAAVGALPTAKAAAVRDLTGLHVLPG